MTILVSYRERPDGVTEQTVTLASVSTNGKILTPIPAGIESNAVHVSVTDAAGVTKTIATNEKDFIKLGSSRWLDNAAVVQRAREML
jgi:tagatose-1,6-bisphosphate aldolase non-catalytic subunit AgaZ/GatZ